MLATVLFTDIVRSSEIAAGLGDEAWGRLLARHHEIVREGLRRHRGREMDTAGDGFFAVFDRPADAVRCAWALIEDLRSLGLEIRAGVHVGEAETMGAKVGGIAVNVGARVMAKGEAGDILVTGTVRELTAGSGFTAVDRGVHELKGIPGEWRLFAVTELDGGPLPAPLEPSVAEERRRVASERRRVERRPLVLAGAAGAVLGIAALLIVALRGDEPEATPPSTTPSVEAFPNATEQNLLDYMPESFQDCGRAPEDLPSAIATISCVDGDQTVSYALMPNEVSLDVAFESDFGGHGVGDCEADTEAEVPYTVGGERVGRLACFRDEAGPTGLPSSFVAWTDERFLILAVAYRPDLGDLTLLRWWSAGAGPADPQNPTTGKDLVVDPPVVGDFRLEVGPEDVGTVAGDLQGTWRLVFGSERLQVIKERGAPTIAPSSFLTAFGKDTRLILLDYKEEVGAGSRCESTLDLRWSIRGTGLRLSYLDGGCTFDGTRALLTIGPLERID